MRTTRYQKPETVTATCDCGTRHEVERTMVGMHAWWKCTACLEEDHRQFERDYPHLAFTTRTTT